MPYKDADQRKAAARKWRTRHRAERAAYMRRYRRARSTGRGRGRPRSHRDGFAPGGLTTEIPQVTGTTGLRPESLPRPYSEVSDSGALSSDPIARSETNGGNRPSAGRDEDRPSTGAAMYDSPDWLSFGIP
jgi:hypothetical protein